MATKPGIFSPTTTIHHRFSTHCLPPSTRNLVLKSTGFQCKAVSNSRIQEFVNETHTTRRVSTSGDTFSEDIPIVVANVPYPDAEYSDVHKQNRLPLINLHYDNLIYHEDTQKIVYQPSDKITQFVDIIKTMLDSMDEGEISVSAYDTAWVALVQDVNGSGGPQFPSSLEWIVNNQLSDGSWGDRLIFSAHDRLINTLACIIALTYWNVHPTKCQQGLKFLKENISKLDNEYGERMPIGFEVAFPSLIKMARKLKLEVPEDTPAMKEIYARRNLKITKIPKEVMHTVPTTLLHSLEGMLDLEWEKLLKLQCKDGSFLFSPASTAFALMQTKDEKCLQYLTNIVTKFNGGVPNVYPVDLFEHIWVVDCLQRLGISRYFEPEIKGCVEYIHRYWTNDGICWAKNSHVQDVDDTAMGFRVLRMNGYEISPDVFRQFEKNGKFVCFMGQSTQAITGTFNLYRASQMLFPGEKILDDAKRFSYNYLRENRSTNKLLDKWIINKDLPGEVGYALNVPWYASLPRLETRYYLEQYGGEEDVWIGKTLYRMGKLSNNTYLEMAKLDYNNCLALHHLEWNTIQQWYVSFGIKELGTTDPISLLLAYYLAAASIFEPERSKERVSWAKTVILADTISKFFDSPQLSKEDRRAFVDEFRNKSTSKRHPKEPWVEVMVALKGTLHELASDSLMVHSQDIHLQLHHAWAMWLMRWQDGEHVATQAELVVQTINITAGRCVLTKLLPHPRYQRLSSITSNLCMELLEFHNSKENGMMCSDNGTNATIDSKMQELVQFVLPDSPNDDLDRDVKQTFLTVAKTFYYKAYFDLKTINDHISKVLFEPII